MSIDAPIEPPFSGKRVLVTGASGNLGAELARALVGNKTGANTVYGSARFGDSSAMGYLKSAGVVPIRHELGRDSLDALPAELDYVFNFGAIVPSGAIKTASTVDASMEQVAKVNALSLGEMMRRWPKLAGFVQASSATVYQHQDRALNEADPVGATFGTYSSTKYAGEMVATFAAGLFGIPTAILRIFHSYGPRGGPPTDRIKLIAAGQPIRLHGPGPNIASPLYVTDFVRLAFASLRHASPEPLVVNIGGEPVAQEDYIATIGRLLGVEARVIHDPAVNPSLYTDLTRMKQLLGAPRIPVEEGIRRVLEVNFPERLRR